MSQSFFLELICCVILICPTAFAKECSKEEAIRAETAASTLKNWDDLYGAYKTFSHCDDGAIGEGYSDTVGRLLSTKWETLSRVGQLIREDTSFEVFVLRHIDETISRERTNQILSNARTKCKRTHRKLCYQIIVAASN